MSSTFPSPRVRAPFVLPAIAGLLFLTFSARAADSAPVRPVPPPGVAIPDAARAELKGHLEALGKEIDSLGRDLKNKPAMLVQLPDVRIFYKAVDWALRYDEFFDPKQVETAKKQLETAMQRAKELRAGNPSWNSATGLMVRGYSSKIDGSVQPYGLIIPDDWKPDEKTPRRLDFWCHGRGEKLSELSFIDDRGKNKGEWTPPGAFVLHLYGRYCCANKFAGEVDLFEALENARQHYNIDANKLVVRGFSMGGASTWQFGTHFTGMWAAVQPGAGFGETKEFMKLGTTPDKPLPPPWEQTLWHWYDSTDYVANLANTTTVAYSGEIDGQKQAADIMIRYARKEAGNANPPAAELGKVAPGDGSPKAGEARVTGTAPDVTLYHVIGPQTPHKIKAEAKPEVDKLVEAAVAKHEAVPKKVHLTTYSLLYPTQDWVTVLAMEKEWERADLDVEIVAKGGADDVIIKTRNVDAFYLDLVPAGILQRGAKVIVDGQDLGFRDMIRSLPPPGTNAPLNWWRFWASKSGGKWGDRYDAPGGTRKHPALCGPIDHAFMSSFVFVRPTGKPLNDKVGAWAKGELDHATTFWRKVFRGDAPVKDDTAISDDDIKKSNLVLWGDPSSNKVLAKILSKLPIQWSKDKVVFTGQSYDATHTAPVLIFPNPLNPEKYVVINSGPTFREQALLNNADQTPKLPDWAMIDLNTAPDARWPGQILNAGFFDEQWKVTK